MNVSMRVAVAALSLSFAGIGSAAAQTTLKFTHSFPASHYLWENGGKVFAEEVGKGTNDAVKFEVYPAGQLGRDLLALLKSGIADVAIVPVSTFSREAFPLTSVSELPGGYSTSCEGTERLWNIAKEGGILNEVEYKPNDLRILYVLVQAPYPIMTSRKEVKSLEDLQGLKIRGNGAAHERLLAALGAVSVSVSGPETYDALSRGTIDGALFPYIAMPQYDMQQVLHYSAEGASLGSGATIVATTQAKWDSWSPEVQAAMEKAGEAARRSICGHVDSTEGKIQEEYTRNNNFKINQLSPEELERWKERTASVAKDWETQMNGQGLRGTEVLEAFVKGPQ